MFLYYVDRINNIYILIKVHVDITLALTGFFLFLQEPNSTDLDMNKKLWNLAQSRLALKPKSGVDGLDRGAIQIGELPSTALTLDDMEDQARVALNAPHPPPHVSFVSRSELDSGFVVILYIFLPYGEVISSARSFCIHNPI